MTYLTHPSLEPRQFLIRGQETVTIRPITLADTDLLADLLARLSPETRWRRYFSSRPLDGDLGQQEALRLARAHTADHLALVVTTGAGSQEAIIGVAELVRIHGTRDVGEIALLVRDDYQGLGIGTRLTEALPAAAHVMGIRTVRGETLADNRATQRLLDRWSPLAARSTRRGETTFNVRLDSAPSPMPVPLGADAPRPLVPQLQGV